MEEIPIHTWQEFIDRTAALDGWAFRGERHAWAQLSSSLGRLRHLLGPDAEMHTSRADALSRAYDELGATEMITGDVPCTALLEIIATNLLGLFSGDRSIRLHLLVDHVTMPAEQRRALLLIASEAHQLD